MLQERHNCWRIERVKAGRFLIDAAAYYEDLANALLAARRGIYILGWDIDSRVALVPGRAEHPGSRPFGEFLSRLVQENDELQIYILIWEGTPLFALDRQLFPSAAFGVKARSRLHFMFDGAHPFYASHHQKIVVVDDLVAYCGGLDITHNRYDDPGHFANDARRIGLRGASYGPFHDVQLRVEGDAASALGDLTRERWRLATGATLPPLRDARLGSAAPVASSVPGPAALAFGEARVGIARTAPPFLDSPGVREIERLTLDLIASARRTLYIENQYFASGVVGEAIAHTLRRAVGPEVIVVLPSIEATWLEDQTMGNARIEILSELKRADRYGRLGVYIPRLPGVQEGLKVHSKLLIADDRFALVGSANFCNRSMGLDTECSVVVDAEEDFALHQCIRDLRETLLCEHLDLTRAEFAVLLGDEGGSLRRVIHSRRHAPRRLTPFRTEQREWIDHALLDAFFIDPYGPLEAERAFNGLVVSFNQAFWRPLGRSLFVAGSIIGLALLVLGIATSAMPRALGEYDWISHARQLVPQDGISPGLMMLFYALATFLFVPINLTILATASAFDVYHAIGFGLAGGLVQAVVGYLWGQTLGRERINKLFFARVEYVAQRLNGPDMWPIVYSRFMLWVPFGVVNMVAGAAHVNFGQFILATLIGLLPGLVALVVLQYNLLEFLAAPNVWNGLAALVVLLLIGRWLDAFRKRVPGLKVARPSVAVHVPSARRLRKQTSS